MLDRFVKEFLDLRNLHMFYRLIFVENILQTEIERQRQSYTFKITFKKLDDNKDLDIS